MRQIVRERVIRTQREMVDALRDRGFSCTQATASRDIAELGMRKLPEGIYALAEDLHLQHMIGEFVTSVEAAENLVVIRTQAGTAPGVAAAVDAAELDSVMGSIAGNDTVLVICRARDGAHALAARLHELHEAMRGAAARGYRA